MLRVYICEHNPRGIHYSGPKKYTLQTTSSVNMDFSNKYGYCIRFFFHHLCDIKILGFAVETADLTGKDNIAFFMWNICELLAAVIMVTSTHFSHPKNTSIELQYRFSETIPLDHRWCWAEGWKASGRGAGRWQSGCTSVLVGSGKENSRCGRCSGVESSGACTGPSPWDPAQYICTGQR